MDIFISEKQPQQERNKAKNILTRHCGNKEVKRECLHEKNYLHPENAYLVKYFPKYYQRLALVMKPQHSLLSKIKRIKKLKRFSGDFNDKIPQVDWFKILANSRKEIEEFPKVAFRRIALFFWPKTTLHSAKFFFRITKLQLPTFQCWDSISQDLNYKKFLLIWKTFSKYLKNMRRLRNLKSDVDNSDYDILEPLVKKLNGMPKLLGKLKVLKSSFSSRVSSDILQNKNFCSHLTNLHYYYASSKVTPICQEIAQICKNLKSLSLLLGEDLPVHSQSLDFTIPRQEFPKLQSISICWPRDFSSKNLWFSFIPPASLQNLELNFIDVDLISFQNSNKQENLFDHWKEIKELDALKFIIHCRNGDEMLFPKYFITAMLKKISKLASFNCWISLTYCDIWRYEPFLIKEVPHLYENLKEFKVRFSLEEDLGSVSFDFGFLKPFKNLKEIEFRGVPCFWDNIRDAIYLLEENVRNGEFLTLQIGKIPIYVLRELKDLLKEISEAKKDGTNLKIELALEFRTQVEDKNYIKHLDQLCEIIESKTIKGLEIVLYIDGLYCTQKMVEEVKIVLEKYPRLRNFTLYIFNIGGNSLEYIKRDGEKEQLLFYE